MQKHDSATKIVCKIPKITNPIFALRDKKRQLEVGEGKRVFQNMRIK